MMLARIILCMLLLLCTAVNAADEAKAEAEKETPKEEKAEEETEGEENSEEKKPNAAIYLTLKPQFVVNYGGAGRLKYLKAEVAVRLASSDAANAVMHHMPYIRNNLVMLFAAQTVETIDSQEGTEALRKSALEEVRKLLKQEEGLPEDSVIDFYFNSLLIQK